MNIPKGASARSYQAEQSRLVATSQEVTDIRAEGARRETALRGTFANLESESCQTLAGHRDA
jgi:hypothetical protein